LYILFYLDNAEVINQEKSKEKSTESVKKLFSYDEWVKENSNQYLFDNDLLREQYNYWESPIDKETRLRESWIKAKQRSLTEDHNNEEASALNESISDLVRTLRRKIDQQLIKNRKHPAFGANYKNYNDEELLIDADIEFHKIKKFLQKDSNIIKQDPEIGYRYDDLLKTLKRKKVIENTVPRFGAEHLDEYYAEEAEPEVEEEELVVEEDLAEDSLQKKLKNITATLSKQEELLSASKSMLQVEEKIQKAKEKIIAEFEGILDKENVKKTKKQTKNKIQPPKGAIKKK
jgi:hypothetical protein